MNDDPARAAPAAPPTLLDFRMALFAQTPRAWVTPLLLGLNVAVFAVMVASGVSFTSPTTEALLRWGADFGPYVSRGEAWRLLTNTFVHVGALHILMNMIGLWQIGLLVERLLGNAGYLVTYVLAGLAGSLTSLAVHPFTVSAGASGAIFGIYGALCSYLLRHRGSVPRQALSALQATAITFIGFNVVFGLRAKGIDMAAHTGGFIGGAIAGLAVASPLGRPAARPGARAALTAAAGLVLVALAYQALPRTTDLGTELATFQPIERRAVDTFDDAVARADRGQLDDAQLAGIVEQQVLPPWRDFQRRFARHARLLPSQQHFADELTRYLSAREEAWTQLAQAVRRHDRDAVGRINRELAAKLDALEILKAEERPAPDPSSAGRRPGPGGVTSP